MITVLCVHLVLSFPKYFHIHYMICLTAFLARYAGKASFFPFLWKGKEVQTCATSPSNLGNTELQSRMMCAICLGTLSGGWRYAEVWQPFPWWSREWGVPVRASAGNRWHGQSGHFEKILTKGLFAKGCSGCRETRRHSAVLWFASVRTEGREEGVVIRTGRESLYKEITSQELWTLAKGHSQPAVTARRRGSGISIPWFYSSPSFPLITCWCFLLAKFIRKSEAKKPIIVVKAAQPHKAQKREQRGRADLEEQAEDILHVRVSAERPH